MIGPQLGSKSPNLQAAPNAAMVNNLGMTMSMAPNNGGNGQQLNAMQGKFILRFEYIKI